MSNRLQTSDTFPFLRLTLLELQGSFAICKLPADEPFPSWAAAGDFVSVTRTPDELSIVCRLEAVPAGVDHQGPWRCIRVAGTMSFSLVGVLASLTMPLARAGIGVFVLSTFDTDYLLFKSEHLQGSIAALRAAGHRVEEIEK